MYIFFCTIYYIVFATIITITNSLQTFRRYKQTPEYKSYTEKAMLVKAVKDEASYILTASKYLLPIAIIIDILIKIL